MSFFTDLPLTELVILRTLRKFEGCLEVEGWLKTGNKGHYFQAWLSLKFLSAFLVVLFIRDMAECHLIKVVTMRKLLISAAKMTQLWLGIVQHLVRWPPVFISLLQSVCLREHFYKISEKSIWYFFHARATLSESRKSSARYNWDSQKSEWPTQWMSLCGATHGQTSRVCSWRLE